MRVKDGLKKNLKTALAKDGPVARRKVLKKQKPTQENISLKGCVYV